MARKLVIEVPELGQIEASSKAALVALIEGERQYWTDLFPSGVPFYQDDRRIMGMIACEYDALAEYVSNASVEKLEKTLTTEPLVIFPTRSSAIGRALSLLATSGRDGARSVIASALTVRLGKSKALQQRGKRFDLSSATKVESEIIEAIAIVVGGYSPLATIAEDEMAARASLSAIFEDQQNAAGAALQIAEIAAGEAERRRADSVRFRRRRHAACAAYKSTADRLLETWEKKFEESYNLFINRLQFEASVSLWVAVAQKNRKRSYWSLGAFIFTMLVLIAFCAWIVFRLGDSLAQSFYRRVCTSVEPIFCKDVFSAKGPLSVGAILLAASLLLWLMKIFNRSYREAAQRSHNANERRAFVETYEAMLRSGQVPEEHRAIVLSAIFRPAAPGAPVDDSNGLDVSAVSLIAKAINNRA